MAEKVPGTVAPEVVKRLNESTLLILDEGSFYVYKAMSLEELDLYKTLSVTRSPYLAKVYGTTLFEDSFYAVLEYVEGKTLEAYLAENGPLSEEVTRRFGGDICSGLVELHAKGVVHRDLTPKNLVVAKDGRLKIIDFGISRVEKAGASTDTEFLGTAGFAAPEQYGFKQTSARTDIYSVGVLLNYMLTLKLPNEQLAEGRMRPIIEKCTKMDEMQRYSSANLLRDVLVGGAAYQAKSTESASKEAPKEKIGNDAENTKVFKHISAFFEYIWGSDKRPFERPGNLPGFRRNVRWQKVLAGIFYAVSLILTVGLSFYPEEGIPGHIVVPITFALMFVYPVLLLLNAGSWMDKFSATRNWSISRRLGWCILLYLLGLVFSMFLVVIM